MSARSRGGPKWRLSASLLLLACGCGEAQLEDGLRAYAAQVHALLEVEPAARQASAQPIRLPARRERRAEAEIHTMGGFDFLAIQGCALSQLVGHRNSQLGRVMSPGARLIYELEVLDSAEACLAALDSTRAARLRAVLALKRAELPAHRWNAVWLSEEMEAYLSSSPRLMRDASDDDADLAALRALDAALQRNLRSAEDGRALQRSLRALASTPPLGQSLRALALGADHLSAAAEAIGRWRARTPQAGCTPRSRDLLALFRRSYLPWQPDLSKLLRRSDARIARLQSIIGRFQTPDQVGAPSHRRAVERFVFRISSASEGPVARGRAAIGGHVAVLQPVLDVCSE